MGWVRQGEVWYDDGQHSDEQLGAATSVRFVNPELPHCRVTLYAYPVARELAEGNVPVCTHTEPEGWVCRNDWPDMHNGKGPTRCVCWLQDMPDHLGCSWDLDTLGIETLTDYQRDDREPETSEFFEPNFEELRYRRLETDSFQRSVPAAELGARIYIERLFLAELIRWDGTDF